MIQKNDKISLFQIFTMTALIGNALFVGMGNIVIIEIAKENTWMVGLISLVVGIIPILLLIKVFNYQPSMNIFEKNKHTMGKIFGNIFNFILFLIMLFVFTISLWAMSNFASVKYLTETPILFLASMFMLPIIYANIKGIESISRTLEVLFYGEILIIFIIVFALLKFVEIDNLKPILADGFSPVVVSILKFIVYSFTPLISLLAIPRDSIKNGKKIGKFLILGYIISSLIITIVFFTNMSVVGYNVVSSYRYPEYYVIKKISITSTFDNVENFLSVHWTFNLIASSFLSCYFIKNYFLNTFKKIKKSSPKVINIIIILIGLVTIITSLYLFKTTTAQGLFMKDKFPYIGAFSIIILIIIIISCMIKKKTEN